MKYLSDLKANLLQYKDWIVDWRCLPVRAWIKAAASYRSGDFSRAVELYKQGLSAHPSSPARVNALLDLSHCLFRLRRFDESEQFLRQASVAAPDEREIYVRLARLQLWLGHASEAAWTIRSCLQKVSIDPELATIFITAVVEGGGSAHLIQEAHELLRDLHYEREAFPRLEVARLRLDFLMTGSDLAREDLAALASADKGPFEAVVAFAQILLDDGKIAFARQHLHRSLAVSPEHPRTLRLLARTYTEPGVFFEPEYAVQIATRACQSTGWKGMHEMHMLAKAYAVSGDKISALLIASKAKDTGRRLLGTYPEANNLERLIESLSIGTQA